jgi:cytochrome-b5 reductase
MPDFSYLLVFVASFVFVFGSLVGVASYIDARLKEAGYDLPKIILLGFPKDDSAPSLQYTMIPDLSGFSGSTLTQLLALVLAAATTGFIYIRFTSKSEFTITLNLLAPNSFSSRTKTCA